MENIDPKLKEFLEKEGVYDRFVANRTDFVDRLFDSYEWHGNDINQAFLWDETPEGYNFWKKLNDKYE